MEPLGWIFMLCSLAFVWGLVTWCFLKILRAPPADESTD